jgi:hypothetical protein
VLYRIYSNPEGIPAALQSEIFLCTDTYELTANAGEADFFAYPTHYQVAYDYTAVDFSQHNVAADIQPLIQQRFQELDALAAQYNKKIITVYIRDNVKPLPVDHAIVFRTSLTASGRQRNEFAFPANGRPLQTGSESFPEFVPWQTMPAVGFRGQSLPIELPWKEAFRNQLNLMAQRLGWRKPFKIHYNFGYLHRRNAIHFLRQLPNVSLDYYITGAADIFEDASRLAYARNLLSNSYALCVSGHGNYSFRLYETMAAGRIPLFVNTDCVLPLEELIDYKKLFVWVEADALYRIGDELLAFHHRHQGEAFEALQKEIKGTWLQYLAGYNYYRHLPFYLRHFAVTG